MLHIQRVQWPASQTHNHPNYTAFQLEPVTCMIEHAVCIKVSTVITPTVMIAIEGVLKNSRLNIQGRRHLKVRVVHNNLKFYT